MDVGLMMISPATAGRTSVTTRSGTQICGFARQAPGLGFDVLWSAEHHFFDYSLLPR